MLAEYVQTGYARFISRKSLAELNARIRSINRDREEKDNNEG